MAVFAIRDHCLTYWLTACLGDVTMESNGTVHKRPDCVEQCAVQICKPVISLR
jgi:hypothetical protein